MSAKIGKAATLRARVFLIGALPLAMLVFAPVAAADTRYYRHTFFDNSLMPGSYFYSSGTPSAPSTLEVVGKKLPVETETFLTPPNALRLAWSSQAGGMGRRD
jgi:exo beta-1,2-glucooligosaccharide sophorohydrolase (non-reducing end)